MPQTARNHLTPRCTSYQITSLNNSDKILPARITAFNTIVVTTLIHIGTSTCSPLKYESQNSRFLSVHRDINQIIAVIIATIISTNISPQIALIIVFIFSPFYVLAAQPVTQQDWNRRVYLWLVWWPAG